MATGGRYDTVHPQVLHHVFVVIRERFLEEFHNIRFSFDWIRTVLAAQFYRWFFSKDGCPQYVVDKVLDILRSAV